MKFLKKAACFAAATAMAASTLCVNAYSADASQTNESAVLLAASEPNLYNVYMETDPSVPEAGKELTLNVIVTPLRQTKIGKLNFEIGFDTGNYSYVPDDSNKLLIDDSRASSGYILFSLSSDLDIIKGTVLSLKFKVTNPTGEFYFSDGKGDKIVLDGNGTDISDRGRWTGIKWDQCKHEKYEQKVTKAPTCTETGIMSYICSSCRVSFNSAEIPATGHDWDRTKAVYTQSPSCTASGSMSIPCKNKDCKDTLKETVPALGHDYGAWTVTRPATDTQKGQETRECKRCNAKETRDTNSSVLVPPTTSSPQVSILPTVLFDEKTGVRLDFKAGAVAANTELVVKNLGQTTNSVTYDISLVRNGKTVQPSDTLYIAIDLPSEVKGNSFYVYRHNSDGSYTDMLASYSSGNGFSRVSFKTGHLSEYLVTTERRTDVNNAPATNTSDSTAVTVPPISTTTPAISSGDFVFEFEDSNTSTSDITSVTPPSSNTTAPPPSNTTPPPDVVIGTDGTSGNTANTGHTDNTGGSSSDKSEDDNVPTGILALSVPLIAAAIGIFVAKKR